MIVHVITGLGRGGAENVLYQLVERQVASDTVKVVSLSDEGLYGARLRALGVDVVAMNLPRGVSAAAGIFRLANMLRNWKPHVVQTWMYHADLFGGIAAKIANVPVVWGVHNTILSPHASKLTTRLVARACAAVSKFVPKSAISCSSFGVQVHQKIGYRTRFTVVPNGVDLKAWVPRSEIRAGVRDRFNIPQNAFVFVHAARAHPEKDHVNLVTAFNEVASRNADAWLVLCGTGLDASTDYFRNLPFAPEALSRVVALGARDDLQLLWSSADAFVLSSSGEALPCVLLEAMACALPCVSTDVGDCRQVIGRTGFVVPPRNHLALAEAMHELAMLDDQQRRKMGGDARERVESSYTLDKMLKGYRDVWMQVADHVHR